MGPFVHSGVRGGRKVQIGRCGNIDSITAEELKHTWPDKDS